MLPQFVRVWRAVAHEKARGTLARALTIKLGFNKTGLVSVLALAGQPAARQLRLLLPANPDVSAWVALAKSRHGTRAWNRRVLHSRFGPRRSGCLVPGLPWPGCR